MNFKNKLFLVVLVFINSLFAIEEKTNDRNFSEMAASGTDWLINKGQEISVLKPVTWVSSRLMSTAVFPVCTAVDMMVLSTKQVKEVPFLLLNKDPDQRQLHLEEYKRSSAILKKKTLGLVASPVGILSPDLVTHHFIPNQIDTFKVVPYGKLYSTHAHVVIPQSTSEVQAIIIEAERAGKTISIMGKSMSQGKQAISNRDWNVIINTSKLNKIEIDPVLKTAKVGAGASWRDLQREANQYGLAVRVMQASNIFSIGGSISVNCHGWDYKTGCLRNTILSLTLVDANGAVLEITPQDLIFDYIVGGYGAFGVVVEAVISLSDNLEVVESGVEIAPHDYLAYFNQNIRNNDDVEMHLYRLSLEPKRLFQSGVAVSYLKVSDQPIIANLIDEPDQGSRMDRVKLHIIRRLNWLHNIAWRVEKKKAITNRISSRNEVMRPPINPIFNNSNIDTEWLQEFFVQGEDLADFLDFLGVLLQKNNVAPLNASVRFVKQDSKTKLSYASEGDRFAVVLFFTQRLAQGEIEKTKIWVREVIDYLIPRGGSYYLPYHHFATLEQFRACYPNWESVVVYKQTVDPKALIETGFFIDYFSAKMSRESLFRRVFDRVDGQRQEIRDFLNNVFMQLDEEKFFALMDSILDNPQLDDEQIYVSLYNKIRQAKGSLVSNLRDTMRSLKSLKNELGDQTAYLVGQRKINGYLEIGYPGRMLRPLNNRLDMNGPFYVITDQESLSDYFESGFPRPYDQFIPLNNYEPISENTIPTDSVDLVCIYIGLHHAPEAKLALFIESIKRILRPGGIFILMDHDAGTPELQNLVDVVHSIFNAATGVKPKINSREIRNFHSLQYWIDLVQSHGLVHYDHEPLIRMGDSTLNSLVRFDKPLSSATPETIAESLLITPKYNRPQKQTYLTAPEWQNVRASQRYAAFVEKQPAYRYPYFSEVGGFWKVYALSWNAARKQNGIADVALSDYNLMNLFVGTTMSLEYGLKGVFAAPISLVDRAFGSASSKGKAIPTDEERVRSMKEYGIFIENTPFYRYPYFKDIGSYWSTYWNKNSSLKDRAKGLLVGAGMTVEYTLKGIVSAPMSYIYGSDAIKEAETTHLLIQDKENRIQSVDHQIVVLGIYPEYALKHVEIPRYKRFTEIMLKIAQEASVRCINIAGHDKIQVDVKNLRELNANDPSIRKLYQIPNPTDLESTYLALEVDVKNLCEVIRTLQKDGVEILFIHDY